MRPAPTEPEVSQRCVCIYGEYIAAALDGSVMKGGAELQAALLARTLARHGIRVVVVDPVVREDSAPMPNLLVRSIPGWNSGWRGIRFFTRRLPGLIRVLRGTGASVFYARGFSFRFLVPLYVARRTGKRFVLAAASDTDLLGFRARYAKAFRGKAKAWDWIANIIPSEISHRLLLSLTDYVFVQHLHQEALARRHGKPVIQLNNILDGAIEVPGERQERKNVIIVGTFSLAKGLRVLIPIITHLPDVTFEFVGAVTDAEGRSVKEELEQLPNVVIRGPLDRRSTVNAIARAKVLLNTSPQEGFPNTFLEAWSLGVPVISLHVDPGDVIVTHGLGYVCNGDTGLMERLLRQPAYDLDVARIRRYVQQYHSPETAIRVFDEVLRCA